MCFFPLDKFDAPFLIDASNAAKCKNCFTPNKSPVDEKRAWAFSEFVRFESFIWCIYRNCNVAAMMRKKQRPKTERLCRKKMSNPLKTFALALFVFVHFTLFKLLMFAIPLHHNVFCVWLTCVSGDSIVIGNIAFKQTPHTNTHSHTFFNRFMSTGFIFNIPP